MANAALAVHMKWMRIAALAAAIIFAASLCGCSDDKKTADGAGENASAAQNYPVGSYERKAADKEASGDADADGDVIDFGSGSIFKGIGIESDENGELVCTQADGELQYRITDKRFGTYREFKKFVTKKSGAKALEELNQFFGERNGRLCFIVGARDRGVKDTSQYYYDDSRVLTVSVTHTEECRKKYGVARSDVEFVKDKKGVWKLAGITVCKE